MLSGLVAASAYAHSANFEIYRPQLESDVLCGSFPDTKVESHLKNLKDTGVLPSKSKISDDPADWEPIKAASGFTAFGLPITEILLFPGYRANPPHVALTIAATPQAVVKAITAQYKTMDLKFKPSINGSFTSINKRKGFVLNISKQGAATTVSCDGS